MSEETLCLQELGRLPAATLEVSESENKPSQNLTFCNRELTDIEHIKPLLLKHYTQEQIAQEMGYARETISRKISKWMQTDDFKEWAGNLWLNQYNEFSSDEDLRAEAFKALTKLLVAQTTRKTEVTGEFSESKTVTYTLNYSEEDKNAILSARRAIHNRRSSTTEPVSLH